MREDTPGGGIAPGELEVMNILSDRRGCNEFKLNYMSQVPHERQPARQGGFKGAEIITPFSRSDKTGSVCETQLPCRCQIPQKLDRRKRER